MTIGPGEILGGKYRLEDPIGRGGMGEVFEAIRLDTGKHVAIKVVNRSLLDTTLVERLRREAEAARRVQSEFVPQLYDVQTTPDGELFLVMERLHGETLSARLRARERSLTWAEVFRLGEDVLRGLHDAHAAGVVHRDLKPGNIFLEEASQGWERARILDFGVCKLDVHDGEQLTTTGEAVGTVAYMAPEQIRGASKVDERADLYGFAMVVFESLSGRLAYEAEGSIALIAHKLEKSARSIRDHARTPIPAGLEPLLARCLARDPSERPASAADLLREWRALGEPTIAPTPLPPGAHVSEPPTVAGLTAAPTLTTNARARSGGRVGLAVAAGAVVASCIVLAFALRPPAGASGVPSASAGGSAAASAVGGGPRPIAVEDLPKVEAPVVAAPPPVATTTAPPLALPPVLLSGGAAADPRPPPRGRPGRRTPTPSGGGHRPPTEPQMVTEPRY